MSKRLKLVLAIIAGVVIIASGAIFGLAKTGTINLKMLADAITPGFGTPAQTEVNISLAIGETIPSGTQIILRNTSTNQTFAQTVTDPGDNIFTGNYTLNVPEGSYVGDESKCVRVYPFTASEENSSANGEVLTQCNPTDATVGPPTSESNPNLPQTESNTNEQLFTISGKVIIAGTNTPVAGAEATINSNMKTAGNSNSSGSFVITGEIPFETEYIVPSSLTFTINAQGYARFSRNLSLVKNPSIQDLTNIRAGSVYDVGTIRLEISQTEQEPNLSSKFDLQGFTRGPDSKLLGDVEISIICPDAPANSKAICQSGAGTLPSTKSSESSSQTNGKYHNYKITDLVYPNELFEYQVRATAPNGYYFDKNNNNKFDKDENSRVFSLAGNLIIGNGATGQNLAELHIVGIKKIPERPLKVFGSALLQQEDGSEPKPLGGVSIDLVGPKLSHKTISKKESDIGYINKMGNFEFPELKTTERDIVVGLATDQMYISAEGYSDKFRVLDNSVSGQLISDKGVDYLFVEFVVTYNFTGFGGETFSFFGKTTFAGDLVPGVEIGIRIQNSNFNKKIVSEANLNWPKNEAKKVANYALEGIPYDGDLVYIVEVKAPSSYKIIASSSLPVLSDIENDPEDWDRQDDILDTAAYFIPQDIYYNNNFQSKVAFSDFLLIKESASLTLHYNDATTGEPIDIEKENPRLHTIIDYDDEDRIAPSRIEYNTATFNLLESSHQVQSFLCFESESYELFNLDVPNFVCDGSASVPLSLGEQTIYLVKKNSNVDDFLSCRTYSNDIKFCTYRSKEDAIFSHRNSKILTDFASIVSTVIRLADVNPPPYIFIWPSGNSGVIGGYTSSEPDSPIFIPEDGLKTGSSNTYDWRKIVVHEFAHYIWFNIKESEKLTEHLEKAFDLFSEDFRCTVSLYPSYECFSMYSHTDPQEFWAEFFQYWVYNADKFDEILLNPSLNNPDNARCKNALIMMDDLLRKRFPNMPRFKEMAADIINSMSINNTPGSENSIMNDFMSSAGYQPYNPTSQYAIISSWDNLKFLTPTQIASGVWLKENYDALPLTQKATLQVSILKNQIINTVTQNRVAESLRVSIKIFNDKIQEWLAKLGVKFSNYSVYGKLIDNADGKPLSGFRVEVGSKSDVTDVNGNYKVEKVMNGKNLIKVFDENIGRQFNIDIAEVTIASNIKESVKKDIKVLNRREFFFSGTVSYKGKLLDGGKVEIYPANSPTASNVITINSKGEFSAKVKEGKYRIRIRYKTGSLMAPPYVPSMENADSLIIKSNQSGVKIEVM